MRRLQAAVLSLALVVPAGTALAQHSRTEGTAIGAVAGAVIGRSVKGAVIGAAVGNGVQYARNVHDRNKARARRASLASARHHKKHHRHHRTA